MKSKNRIIARLGCTIVLSCASTQAANISMNGSDGFNQTSFNSGLRWTGGAAPSAGNAYFTSTFLLRTPATAGTYSFAGDSLSLDAKSTESFLLKSNGSNITINDLRLNGGIMAPGDNGSFTLNGNITTNAITAISLGLKDGGRSLVLNSNVSGTHQILVGSLGTVGGSFFGTLTLGGNNSGFSGGWSLGGSYTNAGSTLYNVTPTNATIKVNHASALGTGNLALNGGTLDLNGFSPSVANFSGGGGTVLASTGSSVLSIGTNNATGGNFAGNVTNGAGQVAITKTGTGTITLSGTANTYSGNTTVNGGTLNVPASQSGGGNVTIADGATFGVDVTSNGDSLAANTLLAGGSTGSALVLNTGATGNPGAAPVSATTLTLNAPTTIRLAGTALTVGTGIPLVSYTTVGGTSGLAGITLQLPARTLGTLDTSTSGLIKANITTFEQIKWVGNVSGVWDIDPTGTGSSGTANWKTTVSNAATRCFQGTGGTDSVNFDDSATGTTAITIDGADVSPAGLVFNNSSKHYTIGGTKGIAGATSLAKSGSGSLALNNTNSFSGGIIVNNGSLVLGAANTIAGVVHVNTGTLGLNHASAMGSASITLEDGAKLDNTSGSPVTLSSVTSQTWNGDITFTGTNDLNTGIGDVSMPFGSAVTTTSGTLTLGGALLGPGTSLTKRGAGTLSLLGTNNYSAGTYVEAGTLSISATVSDLNQGIGKNNLGVGPVDVATGASLNLFANAYKVTFGNTFSGAGTVNMQSYVGTNPFAGDITLTGDWSSFTGVLNLSTTPANVNRVIATLNATFVSPDAAANVSIGNGTTLWLSGTGQDFPSAITLSGNGNAENRGALRLDSVNITGPVSLADNSTIGSSGGTVVSSITGAISGGFQLASATAGGRTILLSGNNTHSGGTLIQGCALEAGHNNAFGSGTLTVASANAGSVGRAIIGDAITVGNAITLSGTQAGLGRGLLEGPASGIATVTGPVSISATPLSGGHFASTGGSLAVQGAITSSVPVSIRDGNITLSGGGTYSELAIAAGTTTVGAANGISTSAVVDLGNAAGATLELNGFSQQLAGLTRTAANPATVTNSGTAAVLTIDTTGTPAYAGDITGALALVKSGSGSQSLSGAVSFNGNTTVSAGTLQLGAPNTGNDSSSVSLATGATLNLSFDESGGAVTDTVATLFINGIQQSPGVYKATGNGADVGTPIAQIAGNGTLTVTSGPTAGFTSWANANGATGQTPEQDHDNDGVKNGIEYFMGQTGTGFTALPVPDSSGKVSWTKSPAYSGTFAVQTSPNLSAWTTRTHTVNGNQIEYTLPSGQGKLFVRLLVTPN